MSDLRSAPLKSPEIATGRYRIALTLGSDAIFDGDRGSALGSDSHSMTKSDCRLDNRLSLQGFLLPWASAEAPWPSRKKALGENCRYHWLAAEVRTAPSSNVRHSQNWTR